MSVARSRACSSSAVLPTPGSPRTIERAAARGPRGVEQLCNLCALRFTSVEHSAILRAPVAGIQCVRARLRPRPRRSARARSSAWSTTSTPSFSALAVLLAPTFSPQISMSVLAETEDAVVAPARSQSRWNAGRGTFSPLRGSAIVPVMTTVLPASGASAATCGGRSSSSTSSSTPSSRIRTSSARVASRLRCASRLAATFGPMSSTCWSASSPASATSSRLRVAGAAEPRGGGLGGHRDREADQRAPQADAAAVVDRLDHAVGRDSPMRSKPSSVSRSSA